MPVLELQELEEVGAPVTDVNVAAAGGGGADGLAGLLPQAAFAVLAGAAVGARLLGGDVGAAVEGLVEQAEHAAALGLDGQAVVAEQAAGVAVAQLAQVGQGEAGEVQLGAVME